MPRDDTFLELVKRVDKLERELGAMRSQQLFIPPTGFDTNRLLTLNANDSNRNGYTLVDRFESASLNIPPYAVSRMRITFEAATTESLTITNAYIGHGSVSGNAYDFLSTPVQLLFSGSASGVAPISSTITTDWALFNYNKVNSLIVAFYLNGGVATDSSRALAGLTNIANYLKAATNEAGTVVKSAGYSASAGVCVAVNKIESDGF